MHKAARAMPGQSSSPLGVEEQVLANLRNQTIGAATVSDLGLPEPFLRRVAGRVLQLSFQEHFRIVVGDGPGQLEHEIWKPKAPPCEVDLVQHDCSDVQIPEGPVSMPPSRGFFPPLVSGDTTVPLEPRGDPSLVTLIGQRLAKDGVLLTATKAIAQLQAMGTVETASIEVVLRDAGFPIDLLSHFVPEGVPLSSAQEVIGWLTNKVVSTSPANWARTLAKAVFVFRPTEPGFRAHAESGQVDPSIAHMQLSRGGYWIGPGDGGSIDLLRQVAEALPSARVIASVESRHVDELRACMGEWPEEVRARVRLIAQDLNISQWAQDSAKGGSGGDGRAVLLAPRFATRGEEVSLYVPGDTYLSRPLNSEGLRVRHSPLLFQGGNLLVVEEAGGRRVLLAGEAEVFRNQSLGLTREQAMAALSLEMGTDKCVVLPAASIHIDYEVSCRVVNGKTVAFVIDTIAGARLVVEASLEVFRRLGLLTQQGETSVLEHLGAGRGFDAAAMVWQSLRGAMVGPGRFPLRLAKEFRAAPPESGVGNLHRLMAALDILMSSSPRGVATLPDPNLRVHLGVLARRLEDRAQLRAALRNLGWTVVAVPGLSHSERSINPLNGLHTPNAYLFPAYGGLYEPLDKAAQGVLAHSLGAEVAIVPIRSAESQRRDGALRCSVCLV